MTIESGSPFVGGGKKKSIVEDFIKKYQLQNAVLALYQPRESLDELLAAADCHFVSLLVGVEASWSRATSLGFWLRLVLALYWL